MIELKVRENGQPRRIIFSGDIGQWNKPIIRDPSVFTEADYVVMESTYGNAQHTRIDECRDATGQGHRRDDRRPAATS